MSVSRRAFLLGATAAIAAAPLARMAPATVTLTRLGKWDGIRFVEECVTYPAGPYNDFLDAFRYLSETMRAAKVSPVEIDGEDHYFVVSHPNPWRDLQREMTA